MTPRTSLTSSIGCELHNREHKKSMKTKKGKCQVHGGGENGVNLWS